MLFAKFKTKNQQKLSFFNKIGQFSVIIWTTRKLNFGLPKSDLWVIMGLVMLFWSEDMCKYIKTCLKVVLITILEKIKEIRLKKS